MSRFHEHFKMNEDDAIEYAREKLDIFEPNACLECKEIGDGNINYIFRVRDENTGKSVIIKHADHSARSTPGRTLTTDRNRIEAEILQLEEKLAPGTVPHVYLYDPVMCCLCMEDLSDHQIMRYALIEHRVFPRFAQDITDFLVKTLLPTTDVFMNPTEKKEWVKRYINPELCKITEGLVYTDPYTNFSGRNVVIPSNADFADRELYRDQKLRLEVAKLKNGFQNNAQALIHGDLHTGSIFVKEDSTKIIDPEFAFYGPIGYDIGNVVANLLFAWVNAYVAIRGEKERCAYLKWMEKTVTDVVNLFIEKYNIYFDENAVDIMTKTSGFREWYLSQILADTAGVAGLEMHRRTVGSAKVKDLTSMEGSDRTRAERIVILAGKELILHREDFSEGGKYIEVVRRMAQTVGGQQNP